MTMAHLFDAVANLVEYSRPPHLHRDWAGPCHICTRDWAHDCDIGTESSQPGNRICRANVLRSARVRGVSPII